MLLTHRELGQRFARRVYGPRSIGCLLCALLIGAVLLADPSTPRWLWLALAVNAFLWPTLAYLRARGASDPFKTEGHNLTLDGLAAGLWAGAMGLNLLPSALLISMVTMNAMAAGGWSLVGASVTLQVLGLLVMLVTKGFALSIQTSALQLMACLPMLVIYPLTVARASYSLTVQLAVHKKAFKLLSKLDGMTRLLHHAAWMEKLEDIFLRSQKGELVAMLALIDIDDFKRINDHHGHLVGDAIIGRLANLLHAGLGETAIAGRYGGDEFCVLFFDVSVREASDQLNDIRKRFCEWADGTAPTQASLSIGLVPYSDEFDTERDWLKATDEALYSAKQNGKDRLWIELEKQV